ncbi:hypothetical protein [uncultured Bacteroides sp.]|uniref:hypothetical protein n=1 Tax=uncultured Bacteroides sp. TaxID=162156 RepID=UPI002606217B|nr:hypothetical protein [uncultured Bacteroides sp.]
MRKWLLFIVVSVVSGCLYAQQDTLSMLENKVWRLELPGKEFASELEFRNGKQYVTFVYEGRYTQEVLFVIDKDTIKTLSEKDGRRGRYQIRELTDSTLVIQTRPYTEIIGGGPVKFRSSQILVKSMPVSVDTIPVDRRYRIGLLPYARPFYLSADNKNLQHFLEMVCEAKEKQLFLEFVVLQRRRTLSDEIIYVRPMDARMQKKMRKKFKLVFISGKSQN